MKPEMNRRTVVLAGLAATVAGIVSRPSDAEAQEPSCTPVPDPVAAARAIRVTTETIGFGRPQGAPGHILTLFRFTVPPSGVIEPHRHPGTTIFSIEEGALIYTLLHGTATLQRKAGGGDLVVGEDQRLLPGDTIVYDLETAHSARNEGDIPVVALAVTLLNAEQPGTIPTDEHGNML